MADQLYHTNPWRRTLYSSIDYEDLHCHELPIHVIDALCTISHDNTALRLKLWSPMRNSQWICEEVDGQCLESYGPLNTVARQGDKGHWPVNMDLGWMIDAMCVIKHEYLYHPINLDTNKGIHGDMGCMNLPERVWGGGLFAWILLEFALW